VEASQPYVVVPIDDEAHQRQGLEPMEATTNEDVQSGRAESITAALSAPAPELPTTSAQQAQKDDVVPIIKPGTQLHVNSLEFAGLMKSWSELLNQVVVFDGQLKASICNLLYSDIDIF
jgi:hypothetical protein